MWLLLLLLLVLLLLFSCVILGCFTLRVAIGVTVISIILDNAHVRSVGIPDHTQTRFYTTSASDSPTQHRCLLYTQWAAPLLWPHQLAEIWQRELVLPLYGAKGLDYREQQGGPLCQVLCLGFPWQ